MRPAIQFGLVLAASVLPASPAYAAGSIVLPEPNALTLLSLGLAGLIIGRRALAGRRDPD